MQIEIHHLSSLEIMPYGTVTTKQRCCDLCVRQWDFILIQCGVIVTWMFNRYDRFL